MAKFEPKDIQCMKSILAEMNVKEYDQNVPHMLLEVARRYVVDILDDAKSLAQLNGKRSIDDSDVRVAAKLKLDHYFTKPPPRELLLETARTINSNPLPPIKSFSGPKFPPDRYCLTNPNYKLASSLKPNPPSKPAGKYGTHFHSMSGQME